MFNEEKIFSSNKFYISIIINSNWSINVLFINIPILSSKLLITPNLIFLLLCNSFNTCTVSSYNSYVSEVVNLLYKFVDNVGNINDKSLINKKIY